MEFLGRPVVMQNTDTGHWLVTCDELVTTSMGESVSFTTAVERGQKTVGEMQLEAAEKAIELLQQFCDLLKKKV